MFGNDDNTVFTININGIDVILDETLFDVLENLPYEEVRNCNTSSWD